MGFNKMQDNQGSKMTVEDCVWPSGDEKPICLIRVGHEELSRKFGLVFENGVDDLDEYFGSLIVDEKIGPIKFLEYVSSPVKGVSIYVDSKKKASQAVFEITKKFDLEESDFVWRRELED
jgi:hypothetical protein